MSAGVAGALVPIIGRSATPCPPPSLSISGGQTVGTDCAPPPPAGTAPAWFVNMPDRTWATPVTNTLDAVKPTIALPGNDGHAAVCNNWTGGTVDQDRGEFVLAANGGHFGYAGNEVYACALRSASPAWQRIWGPSPLSAISGGVHGQNTAANYGDGNPRAAHTYNRPAYGNGKIWLCGIEAMYDDEQWSTAVYSFDRASLKWDYHGIGVPGPLPGDSYFSWQTGPGAYDRIDKRVWNCGQYNIADGLNGLVSVDALTGNITQYGHHYNLGSAWSVVAHDLRLWIIGAQNSVLWIMDLTNPAGGFIQKSTTGSPTAFGSDAGAVYHQPSRAILCWSGYGTGLRKLAIPSDPKNGTYTWSTVSPAAGNSVTPSAAQPNGTYGRFNIVENMGNGQSALCIVNDTTGPTYVYKLPANGV
jgi:hypothetical protein